MGQYEGEDSLFELSKIATWMNQDRDLWLCRRFEKLHIFNILSLQHRLAKLEQRLDRFIKAELRGGGELFTVGECSPEKRESLAREIQATLKAYDEALLAAVEVSRFKSPAVHTAKVVDYAVSKDHLNTLAHELGTDPLGRTDKSKLLAILTPPKSWFHKYIDTNERLRRLFAEKLEEDSRIDRYSESRIKKAEFMIISATLCLVQMLPIAALTLVQSRTWKLVIIFILIVIVSILTSLFANTTRASNFGAVAAYSAIVVAFLDLRQWIERQAIYLDRGRHGVRHGSRLVLDVGYGLVGRVESNRRSRALGPDLYPFEREAEDEASVRC